MRTLVALATTPDRVALLSESLPSLRKQCDRLHVYLNGHTEVPPVVWDLADEHVLSSVNAGADKKLHWAHQHDGVYLSCDDDFVYPPDYVPRMAGAVQHWGGKALVTAHGRVFPPQPKDMADQVCRATLNSRVPHGRWVNHAGTGVLAWDASQIKVPLEFPVQNRSDVQLSAWANQQGIPIWVVPHNPTWLRPIRHQGTSVGASSRAERHATNNALLHAHPEWKLHEIRDP
jgi:hypothetical protein